jgi:hypothetical protein
MNWFTRLAAAELDKADDKLSKVQRYGRDQYAFNVYLNETPDEKYTVAVVLNHGDLGVLYQEFWKYIKSERSKAETIFETVKKEMEAVFDQFRDDGHPTNAVTAAIRERCRYLDNHHKPVSRIPYINFARRYEGEQNLMQQIYGPRYPLKENDGF